MNKVMMMAAMTAGMMALTAGAVTDAELLNGLRRQYETDMRSDGGRTKWHGKMQRTEFVTNGTAVCERQVYEDGFVNLRTNKLSRLNTAKETLTRAERVKRQKAFVEKNRKAREERERKQLQKLLEKHPELKAN